MPNYPEPRGLTRLLTNFYTVPRLGQERLSDGGGPFGFDITTALQITYLLRAYACDGIVETGCHLGDTTEFLARQRPDLPVRTCDIEPRHAEFTRQRLRHHPNVTVVEGDSAALLPRLLDGLRRPLVYLDAHWSERWPLRTELAAVDQGVVAIGDFAIGHPSFGYDTYGGVACGPELVAATLPHLERMYIGDPHAPYPLPCLQTGRRTGTGYLTPGLDTQELSSSPMFLPVPLRPSVRLPSWDTAAIPQPALTPAC